LIRFEFSVGVSAAETDEYPNWNDSSKTVQYETMCNSDIHSMETAKSFEARVGVEPLGAIDIV
jgi:hypothetical protein